MLWALSASMSLIASAGAQEAANVAPKDTILILDASGSMWGQIDGVNKIVIAKDVVEGLVRSLPESRRLGFVAYGHRQKGDCTDIETLADVGADRSDVIKRLRQLSPMGKTPLTKSVEHAAEELNYTKNAATVILVSDGLETCEADPCALARTLEENGLDFTVHVVGFDVTEEERRGLRCIADETGGVFLAADDADELSAALTEVADVSVEAEPITDAAAPAPQTVALKATLLRNGPDIQSRLNWTVRPAAGGDPVFEATDAGYVDFDIVPGDYIAEAVWTGWPHEGERIGGDKRGSTAFTIVAARPAVVTVPIDLGIPVTLDVSPEIHEGEPVSVTWSGPDDLGAYITVNGVEDGPRDQIYFLTAQRARDTYEAEAQDKLAIDTNGDGVFNQDDKATQQVGGPSNSGDYEVRYVLSEPRLILAREPLKVLDSPHTLRVPGEVPAAGEFEVEWTGRMTDGDFLTIVNPGDSKAFTNGVTARLVEGQPAKLTAFAEPGDYEVRYVLANGYTTYPDTQYAVQESVPLRIVAVSASISAPDTAVGGSTITLQIETPGEGWENDMLSIVEPGAEKTNSDARSGLSRIRNDDGSFSIRVPAIEGDYEIAYFLEPGSKVIARRPLTITRAEATVDAPDTIKVGEVFQVTYSGDGFPGDRVLVMPADTPDDAMWRWSSNYGFAAKPGETVGQVNGAYAVQTHGTYEVRYVTGLQHQVLARDRVEVIE